MASVSLRVVVGIVVVLMTGGMIALVVVGAKTAADSVHDVCWGLREQIAGRVAQRVASILGTPFQGMARLEGYYIEGIINPERQDALHTRDILFYQDMIIRTTAGWGANLYTTNEYGQMSASYRESTDRPRAATMPPLDQITAGSPTWSIPCRYQSNCTDPSNWLHHAHCANASQWGDRAEWPLWAQGLGAWLGPESLQAYSVGDVTPDYARWAVAQNPTSESRTYCRPSALGAKPPCPDGHSCPEFNFTYYSHPAGAVVLGGFTPGATRTALDPRGRWWYVATKNLTAGSKYYADVEECATTGAPCFTATQPLHVRVPRQGALVRVAGQPEGVIGLVTGHTQTAEEMFTPEVLLHSGSAPAYSMVVGRRELALACGEVSNVTGCCEAYAGLLAGSGGVADISPDDQVLDPKFIGVIASDFYTTELIKVAEQFEVGKTGSVFIGDYSTEALLLTSGFSCEAKERNGLCFQRNTSDGPSGTTPGGVQKVSAFDSYAGPVVSGVMRDLFSPRFNVATQRWSAPMHEVKNDVLDRTVTFGGSSYWVRFHPMAPLMDNVVNLNWWVCVVIPHSDYLQDIQRREIISLAASLTLVVLLLASLIGVIVAFFVRPISLMMKDFESACSMRLEDIQPRRGGFVSELQRLQGSFNSLVGNLRLYKPFLPPSCFGTDAEDDSPEEQTLATQALTLGAASAGVEGPLEGTYASSCSTGENHFQMTLRHQLSEGLRRKKVVIASVNLHRFHQVANSLRVNAFEEWHADFICRMLQAAGVRCNAETFSGDRMVFSWNSLQSATTLDAPYAAALRMVGVTAEGCEVHIGLAAGEALCGALGPEQMKKFSLIGPCYGVSVLLMTLNKHYAESGPRILMDDLSCRNARVCDYLCHFVDAVRIPKLTCERTSLWSLVERRRVRDVEWMYTYEEESCAEREWAEYLSGARTTGFTTPRIAALVGQGVAGPEYVGADPGIVSLS